MDRTACFIGLNLNKTMSKSCQMAMTYDRFNKNIKKRNNKENNYYKTGRIKKIIMQKYELQIRRRSENIEKQRTECKFDQDRKLKDWGTTEGELSKTSMTSNNEERKRE